MSQPALSYGFARAQGLIVTALGEVAEVACREGGNPLVPKSPDIDTFVRVRFDWLPGFLKVEGEAAGDNFPALEIFLYSYVTKYTALLFDGSTTGGPNVGPAKRLFGSHKGHVLGRFRGLLALDANRDLATNYTVPKAKMPDY